MPRKRTPQTVIYSQPPKVCPKPECGGTSFIQHEDGWQCLNCMKIIYLDEPLPYIANNRPERLGHYDYRKSASRDNTPQYSRQNNENSNLSRDNKTPPATEARPLEEDLWDWLPEYEGLLELPGIQDFERIEQLIRSEAA